MTKESAILIVDDDTNNLKVLHTVLEESGYDTMVARSGQRALYQIEHQLPDLILLDVLMPGIDGFETCRRIKINPVTAGIPIIFLTALGDVEHKIHGFDAGGVDYITKPFDRAEVVARVNTHLSLHYLQQELETSNAQLTTALGQVKQLIKRSGDAIIVADEMGRMTEWNPAAEQLFGLPRSEALGQLAWDIQLRMLPEDRRTPATREQIMTNYLTYVKTGQDPRLNQTGDIVIQCVDGSYRDVQAHPFTMKLGSGMGYGNILRDITKRKQTEQIEAVQLTVSQILAGAPDPVEALPQLLQSIAVRMDWQLAELWWHNDAGSHLSWRAGWRAPHLPELTRVEQAAQELEFEPGAGLPGRVWQAGCAIWDQDVLPAATPHSAAPVAAMGLRSAVGFPLVVDQETVGVMTFFRQSARPLPERLLKVLADLGRQIGQFLARKQAEVALLAERASLARQVAEQTAELRLALRAKDEFLSTMSHELRTPLNAVLGMAEILLEGIYGPLDENHIKPVQLIEQGGQQLLTMINDILDFVQLEASNMRLEIQPVHAGDVCRSSLQLVNEAAAKKRTALSLQVADDDLWLHADPWRLKQILVNLLSNAIKFTPDNGQVNLAVIADPARAVVCFSVQDNGIGIAAQDMAELFKPFTQLDASLSRRYEGAGLGLALTRQLVKLHGGTIQVTSDGVVGRGSCFTVSLPWEPAVL